MKEGVPFTQCALPVSMKNMHIFSFGLQFDTVQLAYYNILDFGAQFPTKAMVHSRIAQINKHVIDSHILKKLSRVTKCPVKSVKAPQILLVVLLINA